MPLFIRVAVLAGISGVLLLFQSTFAYHIKPEIGKTYWVGKEPGLLRYQGLEQGQSFTLLGLQEDVYRLRLPSGDVVSVRIWIIEEALNNHVLLDQDSFEKEAREKAELKKQILQQKAELEKKILQQPDPPGSFLSRKIKFRPDGKLGLTQYELGFSQEAGKTSTFEEGEYNGVVYRFYHWDGSGTFGRYEEDLRDKLVREALERVRNRAGAEIPKTLRGWSVSCEQDAMDDRRFCHVHKSDLSVFVFDDATVSILIGSDHYPGSAVAMRFGSDAPTYAGKNGWSGTQAHALVKKLMSAKTVRTRFQKWPNQSYRDDEVELFGFKEAYEYLRFAVTQPAGGSFKGTAPPKPSKPRPSSQKRKKAI